jgi:hypothetical protein
VLLFGSKQKMNQVNTLLRFFKTIAPSIKMIAIVFICLFFISTTTAQFVTTEQSLQKTNVLINQTFGDSIELLHLSVNSNYQSVKKDGKIIGYSCIEEAKSKHDRFEFVVLYDAAINILEVKVLLYREDYGYEIKSKRWLKQFSTREVRKVQAISGATISVNSLKSAVKHLSKKMKEFVL